MPQGRQSANTHRHTGSNPQRDSPPLFNDRHLAEANGVAVTGDRALGLFRMGP